MGATVLGTVTVLEGNHFRGMNSRGQVVDMDSRPGGEPTAGFAPMELLLQSAGGCTGMDIVFILRKRRLEPEKFEVKLEGIRHDDYPRAYESLKLTYRAKGEGITVEELQKAAELSVTKYCSVLGTIKAGVQVSYSCELMD